MSKALNDILEIGKQVKILNNWSYRICGKKMIVAPYEPWNDWAASFKDFGINIQNDQEQNDRLHASLSAMIYQYFYSTGLTSPDVEMLEKWGSFSPMPNEQAKYVMQLSSCNTSHDHPDRMWEVTSIAPQSIIVKKNDIYKELTHNDYGLNEPHLPLQVGSYVYIFRKKEDAHLQLYFYYAYSNEMMQENAELIRFYFNISPIHSGALIKSFTQLGNFYQMPFILKCLDHPDYYQCRSDAFVLYLDKTLHYLAWKIIEILFLEFEAHLNEEVPLFAYKVKKGIGFAEDPGNHKSFGMTRSEAVAKILINSALHDDKLTTKYIESQLLKNGISADKMFVNLNSFTSYAFLK